MDGHEITEDCYCPKCKVLHGCICEEDAEILYLAQIDTSVFDAACNFVGKELYECLKKQGDPHVWKVKVLERCNQ